MPIAVPRRRRDSDPADSISGASAPTRCLLAVVACLAVALRVRLASRSAAGGRNHVVDVPDRGIAPRSAAHLVAEPYELTLLCGEQTTPGVHRGELARARL